MDQCDVLIIGAGPGGYVAAIGAAQRGMKTIVVEAGHVGGTCLNRGCVPTKSMMHAAGLYAEAANTEAYGVSLGERSFDFAAIHAKKDEVVQGLRGGVEGLFLANGIELIRGRATLLNGNTAEIATDAGSKTVTAKNILIAAGGAPVRLPEPMMNLPGVVTSDEVLQPGGSFYKRLLIVGGGVIGVEFATMFSALGSEVTIVEALPRVLANMDREISQNLSMILKRRGVAIHTGTRLETIEQGQNGLLCTLQAKKGPVEIECDGVLVAIGRKPAVSGLCAPGFALDMAGAAIKVNQNFQTSVPTVYAIGDCAAGCVQLAHAASAYGLAAVAHMCGETAPVNCSAVPACVYTNPEIATVGITADEAKQAGIPTKVGKYVLNGNAKAVLAGSERSFVKVVSHEQTGVVLGAQMMCDRATDIIGELATAVVNGLTVHQMAHVMRPHPTFEEAVTEAVDDTLGHAIHLAPKRKRT